MGLGLWSVHMRTLRSRAKPISGEPVELFGGPGDGILLRARPPLPRILTYPGTTADHRYQLRENIYGWWYAYRGIVDADS